ASLRISDMQLYSGWGALGGAWSSGGARRRDGGGGGFGDVKAAFALLVVLPPPAAGALGLARLDGAGTGLAADRRIAAGMHRIHRHRIVGDIGLDARDVPVGERIDLDEAALGVELGEGRVGPIAGLAAAQAGDPEG